MYNTKKTMYKISDTANKTDTTNKLIMYNTKKNNV